MCLDFKFKARKYDNTLIPTICYEWEQDVLYCTCGSEQEKTLKMNIFSWTISILKDTKSLFLQAWLYLILFHIYDI